MASTTEISVSQLLRRIGLPDQPVIVDVRIESDYAADPRRIPTAIRRAHKSVADWTNDLRGKSIIISCQRGLKLSQGVAALLRQEGIDAQSLEGGHEAWREAGAPLLVETHIPPLDYRGASLWVTRARPKVDRIACPWLIRRFVDPAARFLFVVPAEVQGVAERFGATPFDIDGVFWSHRGETCTFDTMLDEFGIRTPTLDKLSLIIRAADTAQLNLSPQAAGFLAISLGLSRMYREDIPQLDAGMLIYDALYRWCRDASDETHNWPGSQVKSGPEAKNAGGGK